MVDARGNTVTHGFILVPTAGPYVQQGCARALYYLALESYSRGYKQGVRGREAPKSLLEEELIETSANIGAQERVCSVSYAESSVLLPIGR